MNKNTLKNIITVAFSNCITIISGVIVGFLVPKMLSVTDYGLYKTFTLYATYLGFFSLGIIDGIVLDFGGKDYDQLQRTLFRNFFRWYLAIHICFLAVLLFAASIINNNDLKFIMITLGINMIAVNVSGYYQQISQITQRFKEYSFRKILQSVLNIFSTSLLFIIYLKGTSISYKPYILFLLFINVLLAAWYIYTYRDITFGNSFPLLETKTTIWHLIKIGFPLLFANLCSTLILTVDRQFVNLLFDTTTYALYAFAYNLLALVTVAMSAISTVLYPTLKRATPETIKDSFPTLLSAILFLTFAAISVYFPLGIFITWFLPKYADSLIIFRTIFPGIAMSSAITVIMHNYYKILGKNWEYFRKSIIILLLSVIANGCAYLLFKTTISISVVSVIVMLVWFLYTEQFFVKYYGYQRKKNFLFMIIMTCWFYLLSTISNYIIGFLAYTVIFCIVSFAFFKKLLKIVHM